MATKREGNNIPESLLDAAHIVHLPILLGDILLTNRDTSPGDAHLSDTVHIVLVEVDRQSTEVALGPLGQTPLLLDQLVRLHLRVLADDVSVEDGELCADVAALELARGSAGECGDALRVCEGAVQFLGGGAELIRRGHGGGVNDDLLVGCGGGSGGGRGFLLGLGVAGSRLESAGRVDTRGVLEVLSVLMDQGGTQLDQRLSELRGDLGTDKVLYGLFRGRLGVDVDLKLIPDRPSVLGTEGFNLRG